MTPITLPRLLSACLLSLAVLLQPAALAAEQFRDADRVPLSPDIRQGSLPNGLKYYILKNSRPAQKVELRLLVKAGSLQEDDNQQGLAHFLEHMAFNGTKRFAAHDLVNFLESIGVKMGGDLNAFTGFEDTLYVLPVPTDKPENLPRAFDILEDWAGGMAFDPKAIERESKVVLEEARLRKGAGDRIGRAGMLKSLAGARHVERLPIGKEDQIKRFDVAALQRFYADWYRPELMSVVVVGDVDPAGAEALVRSHFSALVNPPNPRPHVRYGLPPRDKSDALVITEKEVSATTVGVSFSRTDAANDGTYGEMRQRYVERLANAMLADRLRSMPGNNGPQFTNGGIGFGATAGGGREFRGSAQVTKNGPKVALTALVGEVQKAAQHGFLKAELDRAKANFQRGLDRLYNERDNLDSGALTAELLRHVRVNEAMPGAAREPEIGRELLARITLAEVNRSVREAAAGNGSRLASYISPGGADHVAINETELLSVLAVAEALEVAPYTERAAPAALMADLPRPGSIVATQQHAAVGVTEWTLSNGIHVLLKPTDFKKDEVMMTAGRFGGRSLYPDGDVPASRHLIQVVREMGVGSLSTADLRRALAGKSVSVGPGMSEIGEVFNGQSGSADAEAMLQLTYLYFTAPRKDASALRSYTERQRAAMKNMEALPATAFMRSLSHAMFKDHPRAVMLPKPEEIDALNADSLLSMYDMRFSSAKDFNFYFAGSFTLDEMRPLVERYLASLPVGELPTQFRDNGPRPPRGVIREEVRAGVEPKSMITLVFSGESAYSTDERLRILALGEVLKLRLVDVLREQMGATYSVSVNASLNQLPFGAYSIGITIPCGPENVDRLLQATLAEARRLGQQGVTQGDLDKVRTNWLKNYRESSRTNGYWVNALRNSRDAKMDFAELLQFDARANAMQAADVQQAAQRYLDMENYVQVILNPARQ